MSWRYVAAAAGPRLEHTAGTVPERPLDVGDVIRGTGYFGRDETVTAVAEDSALVQLADRLGCRRVMFSDPLAGDFSRCIGEVTR